MANHIEADITLTSEDEVQVPIKFKIEWPENFGYYAYVAMLKFGDHTDEFASSVLQQIIANGDASLLAHLPDDNTQGDDD